jgi:hypothetical protein
VCDSLGGTLLFSVPKGRIEQLWEALNKGLSLKDSPIGRSITKQLFDLYAKLNIRDHPSQYSRFDPRNFAVVVNGKEVQVIYLSEVALLPMVLKDAPSVSVTETIPLYLAPELINGSEGESQQAVDIYALAMIIYENFTQNSIGTWLKKNYGTSFFQTQAIVTGEVFNKIATENPHFAPFFALNPAKRPSIKELLQVVTDLDPSFAELAQIVTAIDPSLAETE